MDQQQVHRISRRCLYFWLCNDPKPGKGNDVTFSNSIFGISKCRTRKQLTFFWNPETKLDKIGIILKENFDFQYLTFF